MPWASWRGVVTARGGPLHHEAVRSGHLVALEIGGQDVAGDDGEESRALERHLGEPKHLARVGGDVELVTALGAVDVDGQGHRVTRGDAVDHPRQLRGHSGADQDDVDVGRHGADQRRGRPQLDLLEQVDADDAVVTLFREPHLHVGAEGAEPYGVDLLVQVEAGYGSEAGAFGAALGPVVTVEGLFHEDLVGVVRDGPPDVAAGVAVLQHARDEQVRPDARDHTEPAGPGDGGGELPAGDPDPHAALDDRRDDVDPSGGRSGRHD